MRRAAALLAAVTVATAGLAGCGGGGSYTLTTTFDDVGDLFEGHSVQIADVNVGTITDVTLTEDFRARVRMEIDDGVRVPVASTALMRTTSLLGEKFIELRPRGEPGEGPFLGDGDEVAMAAEAPEIEFVAEQAIRVLGGVVANDMATLVETGALAFGERGGDIRRLIGDLEVVIGTLAERTGTINAIIDRLGGASGTLARGQDELDGLLVNLARTTGVLVQNRHRVVHALEELTRLARVQNEEVFRPHLETVKEQLRQLDAVVGEVAASSAEVAALADWLARFTHKVPLAIPGDFAQVYAWFVPQEEDPRTNGSGG